jgi:hypothetical protein
VRGFDVYSRLSATGAGLAALILLAAAAFSQEVLRTNYVPSGDYSQGIVGDLWKFTCPPGGSVSVAVDTKNDNGNGTSNLNLRFEIADRRGNLLAVADEDMDCQYTSVCGYDCPQVVDLACGLGNPHTIVIYSHPSNAANSHTGQLCTGGGGYDLSVSAVNRKGVNVKERVLALGGSAKRFTPPWAGGVGLQGPALDDEGVPSFFFPSAKTFGPPPN